MRSPIFPIFSSTLVPFSCELYHMWMVPKDLAHARPISPYHFEVKFKCPVLVSRWAEWLKTKPCARTGPYTVSTLHDNNGGGWGINDWFIQD